MKRTIEIVITVIGALLFLLPAIIGFALVSTSDNPQFKEEFINVMQDPQMTPAMEGQAFAPEQLLDIMSTVSMLMLVSAIIAIVIGLLSIYFLKGDKKPKAAGILLIVAAIIITFTTIGLGLLGGVAYLIAGIVALARKTRRPIDQPV